MRLSHLTALAVMIAMVAAMFAVMPSASAADTVKVEINDSDNVIAAGASYTITVTAAAADGADTSSEYTLEYATVGSGVFVTNVDAAARTATLGPVHSNRDMWQSWGTVWRPGQWDHATD